MKEKVFATLYKLISSGQLNAEEAFYLMKILFEDHSEKKVNFETDHKLYPGVSEVGLHPWWGVNSPTLTTTSDSVTTTYTAVASQPNSSLCTATVAINEPNLSSIPCSNLLLGGDSDITKNCIDTIE